MTAPIDLCIASLVRQRGEDRAHAFFDDYPDDLPDLELAREIFDEEFTDASLWPIFRDAFERVLDDLNDSASYMRRRERQKKERAACV